MRQRAFGVAVAMAVGASACCLTEISGRALDAGDIFALADAGAFVFDGGCSSKNLCRGICFCEPGFCGCKAGTVMCFYEDGGCVHAECSDLADDDNCGVCNRACRPGTHCG